MNAPDKEDFKVNFRLQEERIATMRKEMESQNRGLYLIAAVLFPVEVSEDEF